MIAIAGLLLLVAKSLILAPLAAAWEARAARIAELKKSLVRGEFLLKREQSLRAQWDHMRKNTLPTNTSLAEGAMLNAFERWSQQSGASIASIKPQWKQNGSDYQTLECRADVAGDIAILSRFLYEVEKDPLGLRVEAAEITARDNNGQQLSLGLQLSGLLLTPVVK